MCGVFGVMVGADQELSIQALRATMDGLFRLSESRGKEAAGLAMRVNGSLEVLKSPMAASRFIRTPGYRALFNGGLHAAAGAGGRPGRVRGPLALIGHSRLVTNGLQTIYENNQPVTAGAITGVHNGIIVNVDDLWRRHGELERGTELDSEVLVALVARHVAAGRTLGEAVSSAFEEIEGAATVALVPADSHAAALATNTGSLYTWQHPDGMASVFASEEYILNTLGERVDLERWFGAGHVHHVRPGEGVVLDLAGRAAAPFDFALNPPSAGNGRSRTIPTVGDRKVTSPPEPGPPGLRRCTRCVLPETMPFIEFDEQGACSYCHNYRPMAVQGREALEAALAPHRRSDDRPDCVVAFSGGRDSSYGLHLLKTEFGMNPIALTYDWGMVTDLARRNQARISGKLGIEHILVSADIDQKRKNIGKNVRAWLKKPDLGMVPLFMAGDKQFFYHANRLGKQAGVELVVFCVNPLEKTDFKTGFCGIDHGREPAFYNTSVANKLKLATYYGRQFLANPGYLNGSLLDTAFAYVSSYFLPHQYLMFFDYLRWDEDEINRSLIETYDWETAPDTPSTWRIGDGTAAFYNYIYGTVGGFTENDTFRSNQVREGVITREQALALVAEENRPRYDSIREYLDLIGLDFDSTLEVIDRIPRLYAS